MGVDPLSRPFQREERGVEAAPVPVRYAARDLAVRVDLEPHGGGSSVVHIDLRELLFGRVMLGERGLDSVLAGPQLLDFELALFVRRHRDGLTVGAAYLDLQARERCWGVAPQVGPDFPAKGVARAGRREVA